MQEFMILPVGASSFTESMKMGSEVRLNLDELRFLSLVNTTYETMACDRFMMASCGDIIASALITSSLKTACLHSFDRGLSTR